MWNGSRRLLEFQTLWHVNVNRWLSHTLGHSVTDRKMIILYVNLRSNWSTNRKMSSTKNGCRFWFMTCMNSSATTRNAFVPFTRSHILTSSYAFYRTRQVIELIVDMRKTQIENNHNLNRPKIIDQQFLACTLTRAWVGSYAAHWPILIKYLYCGRRSAINATPQNTNYLHNETLDID